MNRICLAALLLIGSILCSCNSQNTTSEKKADTAVAVTKEVLIDSTSSDSIREQFIQQLVEKNNYGQALSQLDQLLKKNPANPGWLFMKADALEKKGDTLQAIHFYEQATAAAGLFLEAEMRLANLYAETGNKNTIRICDSLLQKPAAVRLRSDILMMKGIYFTQTNNAARAIDQFNQIIREDYSYLNAYIEKGLVYYDAGNYEEAWKQFNKSTEVSNKFADGYFWMAKTEEKMNKKQEAVDDYKRSLALDQNIEEAREALKRLGAL